MAIDESCYITSKEKLGSIIAIEVCLFAFTLATYIETGHVTKQLYDDTGRIVNVIIQIGTIAIASYILHILTSNKEMPNAMFSVAFILSVSSAFDDLLSIAIHHGLYGNMDSIGDGYLRIPMFVTIIVYVGLVCRLVVVLLWWMMCKQLSDVLSYFHHIVMALVFSKMQLLLEVFIIDVDWVTCVLNSSSLHNTEHCAHDVHFVLHKIEITIVALCFVELIYFIYTGIEEGGWFTKGILIVFLVAVITIDLIIIIAKHGDTVWIVIGRSLTFIEVMTVTVDVAHELGKIKKAEIESDDSEAESGHEHHGAEHEL